MDIEYLIMQLSSTKFQPDWNIRRIILPNNWSTTFAMIFFQENFVHSWKKFSGGESSNRQINAMIKLEEKM